MTTSPEVVARIEALALLHPAYGCNRREALLALEGRRLSAIRIQKILNDKGLGTRHERWLALRISASISQPEHSDGLALQRAAMASFPGVAEGAEDLHRTRNDVRDSIRRVIARMVAVLASFLVSMWRARPAARAVAGRTRRPLEPAEAPEAMAAQDAADGRDRQAEAAELPS